MSKVYLAGPISGQSYMAATDWRDTALAVLYQMGITGVSPMRDKEYLSVENAVRDHYPERALCTPKAITTRDRHDVTTCDVVLANLDDAEKVSIGTMIELGWADMLRKPIVVVMSPGNPHWHGMVREIAGWVVPSMADAYEVVRSILQVA